MKLTSRKFWITVAAMSASIATSIAGMNTDNTAITVIGMICMVISSAIYAGAEAYVDANRTIETVARDDDDRRDNEAGEEDDDA